MKRGGTGRTGQRCGRLVRSSAGALDDTRNARCCEAGKQDRPAHTSDTQLTRASCLTAPTIRWQKQTLAPLCRSTFPPSLRRDRFGCSRPWCAHSEAPAQDLWAGARQRGRAIPLTSMPTRRMVSSRREGIDWPKTSHPAVRVKNTGLQVLRHARPAPLKAGRQRLSVSQAATIVNRTSLAVPKQLERS
jgi:hypothetical protein